jgi:hypothetical protein
MWPGMFQAKASKGRKTRIPKKTTMAFNRLINSILAELLLREVSACFLSLTPNNHLK